MPRTVVVIGAGISGLAASYHLSRAVNVPKVILLEASDRLGGWLQTTRTEDGAIFEHGPRGVRPVGTVGKNTLQLVSELGLDDDLLPVPYSHVASKNRYLYVGGKLCILPSGFRGVFSKRPPFSQPIVRSLLREPFVKRSREQDESVHDFAARRFGAELAESAIDSLCRGIFAGDSRKLSVRSCFPVLFDAERKFGSVVIGMVVGGAAEDPRFTTRLIDRAQQEGWAQWSLKGGMQSLPEAMEGVLRKRGVEIHSSSPVRKLQQTAEGSWEVHMDGGSICADHVFSAVPAQGLSRVLPASWGLLCEGLRGIETVSVTVVNLEYEGSVLPVMGFGHLVPSRESGEILGIVYDSCSFPEQDRTGPPTTRLTVMMGGAWFREAFGDPDTVPRDRLLQRATETVRDHLGVSQKPVRSIVKVHKDCIPQYTLGHWKKLGTLFRFIDQHRLPLTLIGASYEGVSVNECIYRARSAVEGLRD